VLARVPAEPALVVATPGAEPVADDGYAAALLLDGSALLQRHGLRAGEEALRRWFAACALVRPASRGGAVALVAPPDSAVVQALVRWDPAGAAERELAERMELSFPPAARLAELSGAAADVDELLHLLHLPAAASVLGPVELGTGPRGDGDGERVRALVRAPRPQAAALSSALRAAQALRSARHDGGPVRVRVDPVDLA
jgi:primosomal protein N' (replication factor Y)